MFSFIDRLIAKLSGDLDSKLSSEAQYAFVRTNIINATNGTGKAILITSSCISQDMLSVICKELVSSFNDIGLEAVYGDSFASMENGYRFVAATGVQKNARAVEIARFADGAILVEEKGRSLYPKIEHCKAQLADVGCKIIGCILYDG